MREGCPQARCPQEAISVLRFKNIVSLYIITRKYPLRGYFLGVLTHTTAWDRLWGGDETLK